MSKIIRTVRIAGPVVTLGEAERGLYLKETQEQEAEAIDLTRLVDARVTAERQQLETQWQQRLEREKAALQKAADQRLQEAEGRWMAEKERVHQQRYEEGYQAGLDAREAEARAAVERLEALHQAFLQERRLLLQESEGLVVDLAVAVARRIIGAQVESDNKVLVRVIRTALQNLGERSDLEIKVHPDDLQVARRFAARWVEKVDQDAVIKIRPSRQVERGGCMIEGHEENVDARLEEQLKVLQQALRAAARGEGEERGAETGNPAGKEESEAG